MDDKRSQLPEAKSTQATDLMVARAYQQLEAHPHFRGRCQTILIESDGQRLILSGKLPSFHLKQLAQESLREFSVKVENRIVVVGFSELGGKNSTANGAASRNAK